LFSIFTGSSLYAQRYDFTASAGTFTPIAGATNLDAVEADDALSITIPIGFSFNYFGSAYTQLKVSSNGVLAIDPTTTSSLFFNEVGGSFGEAKLIAPLWDDLDGSGGQASYVVTGTMPNRVLTIEWFNWKWRFTAASAGISFQVKLYETSNNIEFYYRAEMGVLDSPSAAIGLVGNNSSAFYSLSNSSTSPAIDPAGNNSINSKPVSGQVYSFVPSAVAFTVPSIQASNITAPTIGGLSTTLNWVNGNGAFRAVFMKQTTSTTEAVSVIDGSFYPPSSTFESAFVGSGWYCVYNGTGSSVNITNLKSALPYRVQVVEYNGQATLQKYLIATVPNNPVNITTALVTPTSPVSTLSILRVSDSQVSIDMNEGNGTGKAIFMRAGNSGNAPPVDNTTYTASQTFGSGTQIGTTGWFCIFNGSSISSEHIISGLSGASDYRIHVVDYNGGSGAEKYNVTAVTNNPVQFTTYPSFPVPSYAFVPSAGTFTPISSAIDVNAIEADDALSSTIPIGFTFRHSGIPFTQLRASSNGFVTFNNFGSSSGSLNDLAATTSRPIIAPLWDDLSGSFGGQASYVTTGSAPNRIFTMEWLNWKWSWTASTAGISFQVKLYEVDNKIEFIYRQDAGTLDSPTASIGMGLPNYGLGNFFSLNNSTASPTASTSLETTTISTKPATGQIYTFTPAKINQTVTFNVLPAKAASDAPFVVSASASSGLVVALSSSNTSVATVLGNTITVVGVGTSTITASQAGDATFNAAISVPQVLTVNKASQVITFSRPADRTLGDAPFALTATASSNLAVTYTGSSKVTVAGNQATLVSAGTAGISADQAGNSSFLAATGVFWSFCIKPAKPTIIANGIGTATTTLVAGNLSLGSDRVEWFKNGTSFNTTSNQITIMDPGIYTLVSKADNCVSVLSDPQSLLVTGVEDITTAISIFPNPTQDEVTVKIPTKELIEASLFTTTGQLLDRVMGSQSIRLQLYPYTAGTYIIKVKVANEFVSRTIIKK
jgi:hypothetical protein